MSNTFLFLFSQTIPFSPLFPLTLQIFSTTTNSVIVIKQVFVVTHAVPYFYNNNSNFLSLHSICCQVISNSCPLRGRQKGETTFLRLQSKPQVKFLIYLRVCIGNASFAVIQHRKETRYQKQFLKRLKDLLLKIVVISAEH